jgi:hypothetical protein
MTEKYPKFIWRNAVPLDVIRASLSKPSYITKEELEQLARAKDWPGKLEKRRPFGMLLENPDDLECIVYSRTADERVEPNGLYNLGHDSHNEGCSINSKGVVQLHINARIKKIIWGSTNRETWVAGSEAFVLACFCIKKGCQAEDHKLIDSIHSLSLTPRKDTK